MDHIAPIVRRGTEGIAFRVDDVESCADCLPTVCAQEQLEQRCGYPLLVFEHTGECAVVEQTGSHPLVTAVHLAFSQHRPLVLSPDVIWMTIAQGFSHHVNAHAEELRHLFVQHADQKTLTAVTFDVSTIENWRDVVAQWGYLIQEQVGAEMHDLLVNDFSTTDATIRTASRVVMMEAFQRYFDYHVYCVCGIPSITLTGTVADWQSIHDRVEKLADYKLDWWTDRLIPMCAEFVRTAEGQPSLSFWQEIYKPKKIYGAELVNGWLADLFPYLIDGFTKRPVVRNPLFDKPRALLRLDDGIAAYQFPSGLSEVDCRLTFRGNPQVWHLRLVAGLTGMRQSADVGALQLEIGWGVGEASPFTEMLGELVPEAERRTVKQALQPRTNKAIWRGVPKELIELADLVDGTTIYRESGHPWTIRPASRFRNAQIAGTRVPATLFADLADGRSVGYSYVARPESRVEGKPAQREWWVVVGKLEASEPTDGSFPRLDEVRVIATSVVALFASIIRGKGRYFFDEPGFVAPAVLPTER